MESTYQPRPAAVVSKVMVVWVTLPRVDPMRLAKQTEGGSGFLFGAPSMGAHEKTPRDTPVAGFCVVGSVQACSNREIESERDESPCITSSLNLMAMKFSETPPSPTVVFFLGLAPVIFVTGNISALPWNKSLLPGVYTVATHESGREYSPPLGARSYQANVSKPYGSRSP